VAQVGADIFHGQDQDLKEVGGPDAPITVLQRENSSGTYEFLKEHVLQGKDFARRARRHGPARRLVQAVMKDKKAQSATAVRPTAAASKLLSIKKTRIRRPSRRE